MMNRRQFLSSAGISATIAANFVGLNNANSQNSGPNGAVYGASTSAHAIASGNALASTSTNNDWNNVGNAIYTVFNDWTSNGLDQQLAPYYSQVTPDQFTLANLNLPAILQQIQQFQPSVTLAQLQASFAPITSQPASQIQQVITNMTQSGLAPYLQAAPQQAAIFANAAYQVPKPPRGVIIQQADLVLRHGSRNARSVAHYSKISTGCENSNAACLAAATAFGVIAIMSGPAAVLEYAAVWGAISLWGGTAAGAWGIGNAIVCGF